MVVSTDKVTEWWSESIERSPTPKRQAAIMPDGFYNVIHRSRESEPEIEVVVWYTEHPHSQGPEDDLPLVKK